MEAEGQWRPGGWWDWPVGVIVGALVLAVLTRGGTFSVLLFWFGVISLLIRRGAFTPRR